MEETISTLDYALRAKNIKNKPTVNIETKKSETQQLVKTIEALQSENGMLKSKIDILEKKLESIETLSKSFIDGLTPMLSSSDFHPPPK